MLAPSTRACSLFKADAASFVDGVSHRSWRLNSIAAVQQFLTTCCGKDDWDGPRVTRWNQRGVDNAHGHQQNYSWHEKPNSLGHERALWQQHIACSLWGTQKIVYTQKKARTCPSRFRYSCSRYRASTFGHSAKSNKQCARRKNPNLTDAPWVAASQSETCRVFLDFFAEESRQKL